MQFKTPRIREEFIDLTMKNDNLFKILTHADQYSQQEFKKEVVLTCIYRTPEENAALYASSVEPAWRPHTAWCGADLRSTIYTDAEIQKLLSFLNHFTVYGGQRRCASYHTIAGNVFHFHVQSNP